jgi:hypothetical protein
MLAQIKSSLGVNLDGMDDECLSIQRSIGTRRTEVLSVRTIASVEETEVILGLGQDSSLGDGTEDRSTSCSSTSEV